MVYPKRIEWQGGTTAHGKRAGIVSDASYWHNGARMRLFALRGAVPVPRNDSDSILGATRELMVEILDRNSLAPADVVSCLFTVTSDLNAEFPAKAARELGFDAVPLLCAVEIDVPGAMRSVIRVMVHYHADEGHEPAHVYLGDAQKLRTDLHAAQ